MKKSTGPRTTSRLSESTQGQLNLYALAAGAAGVGLLALAQPSEAKIIYTPKNPKLHNGFTKLDLDNDGTTDFSFHLGRSVGDYYLIVQPRQLGNRVWGMGQLASALSADVSVGPNSHFAPGHKRMAECTFAGSRTSCFAPWINVTDRYLGIQFKINGQNHFGWARLTVTANKTTYISATLTGYAYETVPNKAIMTGKTADIQAAGPGSLGDLATGSMKYGRPRRPSKPTRGLRVEN